MNLTETTHTIQATRWSRRQQKNVPMTLTEARVDVTPELRSAAADCAEQVRADLADARSMQSVPGSALIQEVGARQEAALRLRLRGLELLATGRNRDGAYGWISAADALRLLAAA